MLIVERYDRVAGRDGGIVRLQQEDFCQALGIMPDRKYQADGGPGFADIARLVRMICSAPLVDIERLIDIAVFNVLLGNCDAHGKNFSLLYRDDGIGLSPFYDLVSTTTWPELDTKLSMRFGNEYRLDTIRMTDIGKFADDLGVKPALVRERAANMIETAGGAWETVVHLPELHAHFALLEKMRGDWASRAGRLLGKER